MSAQEGPSCSSSSSSSLMSTTQPPHREHDTSVADGGAEAVSPLRFYPDRVRSAPSSKAKVFRDGDEEEGEEEEVGEELDEDARGEQHEEEEEEGSESLSLSLSLYELALEMQLEIARWLAVGDLARLGMTSRAMSHLADHPSIWKNHCSSRFFTSASMSSSEDSSTGVGRGVARAKSRGNSKWNEWKRVYHRFHALDRRWQTEPRKTEIELAGESTESVWLDSCKVYSCHRGVSAYDLDTGKKLKIYRVQANERDGIVAGIDDVSVRLWNLHDGDHQVRISCDRLPYSMQFKDNKLACGSGGSASNIYVFDLETQKCVIDGNVNSNPSVIFALHLDGNQLATAMGNGHNGLRLWDLRDHRRPTADFSDFKAGVWCCCLSNNLVAAGSLARACLLDLRTGGMLWDEKNAHAGHINMIQFDGVKLVTGSDSNHVEAWNIQTFDRWWQVKVRTSGAVMCGRYEDDALVVAHDVDPVTCFFFDEPDFVTAAKS